MKKHFVIFSVVTLLLLPMAVSAAKVTSDIVPAQRRQLSVDIAERLARRKALAPVPADLALPFSPKDFDRPDPAEVVKPVVVAKVLPPSVKAPPGDRETLEILAAQITPGGMIEKGGVRFVIISGKYFEVGTRFVATYSNQDYDLELVSIDRTTFTLRYRSEELTRQIKPVRQP
ncbi:MAG: hypothetical protein RL077_4829 [Verrucomicrobiota bacterium]|jgi:hypothetical protein